MVKKSSTIFTSEAIKAADENYITSDKGRGYGKEQSAYTKASEELNKLARGSARVIIDIKAVFPFNFFPDEVIVDETKVSIHTHYFFYTKEVRSVEYKDIFNVIVQQGVLFARLEIVDRYFSQDPVTVTFLKKKDAIRARRIIQGMIIATNEGVDTQALPIDELMKKLDRIGKTR